MKRYSLLAMSILVLGLALPAVARADYTGAWALDMTMNLPANGGTCHFGGRFIIQQNGVSLTGNAYLQLINGPAACPSLMNFQLDGTVDEKGCVDGSLFGSLGTIYYAVCPGRAPDTLTGEFGAESGPYAGAGGTFSLVREPPVVEIPTLSALGLALLTLLTLLAGAWVLLRRAQAKLAA